LISYFFSYFLLYFFLLFFLNFFLHTFIKIKDNCVHLRSTYFLKKP
jgi:hypothetical protein